MTVSKMRIFKEATHTLLMTVNIKKMSKWKHKSNGYQFDFNLKL